MTQQQIERLRTLLKENGGQILMAFKAAWAEEIFYGIGGVELTEVVRKLHRGEKIEPSQPAPPTPPKTIKCSQCPATLTYLSEDIPSRAGWQSMFPPDSQRIPGLLENQWQLYCPGCAKENDARQIIERLMGTNLN